MVSFFYRQNYCFSFFQDNIIFTLRSYLELKKLTINGVEINPAKVMTYLGVVLDHKLNWTQHIQSKGL